MSFEEKMNSPEYITVLDKINKYGRMSLTSNEHKIVGSTPPKKLKDHPDKNEIQLMTPDEIEAYFDENLPAYKTALQDKKFRQDLLKWFREDLFGAFNYCKDNNLLPKKYQDFDLNALV